MNTNYNSAIAALKTVLSVLDCEERFPADLALAFDDRITVCSPVVLTAALNQCGLVADLLLVDYPDRADVLGEALASGHLALCLYGLHSAPTDQRWYILFGEGDDGALEWIGGGFDEQMCCLYNAHFCSSIIIVRPGYAQ